MIVRNKMTPFYGLLCRPIDRYAQQMTWSVVRIDAKDAAINTMKIEPATAVVIFIHQHIEAFAPQAMTKLQS